MLLGILDTPILLTKLYKIRQDVFDCLIVSFEATGGVPREIFFDNNISITGFTTLKDVVNNSKIGYGTNNEPIDKKVFSKGHLYVVNNGSAIGYTYYPPDNFTYTHNVNPLWLRKHEMNKCMGSESLLYLWGFLRRNANSTGGGAVSLSLRTDVCNRNQLRKNNSSESDFRTAASEWMLWGI